jgi:hypothetical protein
MAAYELVRKGIPVTMLETGEDIQHGTLVRLAGRNLFRRLPPMTRRTGSSSPAIRRPTSNKLCLGWPLQSVDRRRATLLRGGLYGRRADP